MPYSKAFSNFSNEKINTLFLFLIVVTLFSSCAKEKESEFQSIFDGLTYTGWEGDKDFFRIEKGAIVAGALDRKIPTNQFLCTEENYGDFELRMKVKFTSRENNAGIQFRTSRIPNNHEVIGYQADVGFIPGRPVWGCLYDESRRNKFLVEPSAEKVLKILKPDSWNDYLIRCEGSHIQFWLNGEPIMEYLEEDESIPQSGVICVQIHGGTPAEAWYKDIEIKALP